MSVPVIGFAEGEAALDWLALTQALAEGHRRPRAKVADTVLRRGGDTLLTRSAWIEGLGLAVKAATVFPGNAERGLAAVNGAMTLYDDATGLLEAVIDFHLVTKWKTAGDSLLAARRLARPEARRILIVGGGTVAASLRQAYAAAFPAADFAVWTRDADKARAFAQAHGARAEADLEAAVGRADIVTCATMATEPILRGAWLRPGTHLDLIGAYRADMREADDEALTRGRLFVDSRDTTLGHIGEIADPVARGVLSPDDIVADLYEPERFSRRSDDEITVFKNGGGAHLDLMTARHILERFRAA